MNRNIGFSVKRKYVWLADSSFFAHILEDSEKKEKEKIILTVSRDIITITQDYAP